MTSFAHFCCNKTNADLLEISCTTVTWVYSEWCKNKKTFAEWELLCRCKHVVDERAQEDNATAVNLGVVGLTGH